MNGGTLVASLIMAAVVAVVIAVVIQAMMRGWRRRAQRQAELIGALPSLPDTVGAAVIPPTNDRVAVGTGAGPIWIPDESITAIRTEQGIAGKALTHEGILAIRWRLPSGTEIDTGFRADNRVDYANWLEAA